MEYIEGAYTYTAKPTETTRNAETKISASKTEISVNENTLALLQSTDMFGRVLQKAVITGNAETAQENTAPFAAVVSDYGYEAAGTSAKSRVATLQNRVTYGTAMTTENAVANYGLAYEYDANGNITAEYAVHADNSHTLRYRYTYDEANQLTRVDDNVRGKTFVYQYDQGGNRVSEKIYAYTLSNSLGAVQQTNESKYTFLTWKDRLSSYNGKSITYDLAGNPKQYGDATYVWEGKQLVEIQPGDGSKTQFDYDADGLRTQKRQYGTDGKLEYFVDYVWQNGKLTQQILTLMGYRSDGSAFKIGPINTKFVYDGNSDQPTACFVGEQQMLFVRNLQGDIIAVATGDGEVVAEFSYDAWGNVEYTVPDGVDETWATFIPLFCPLTYRGYNYDFTTGLYYLQSRYYNPEWGRFMNVDDTSILLATQGTSHGANLFAYCENNPVNQVDYTGYSAEFIGPLLEELIALVAIELSFGHLKNDILPSYQLPGQKKQFYYLDTDYNIFFPVIDNSMYVTVTYKMQTTSGPVYFDAEIEYRTDNEWKKLLKDNLFVRASDYIDNEHAPLVYAVGEMASQMGYPFDAIYNLEEGIRLGITSATRGPNARQRQIKAEMARQNAFWPEIDGAFILNWYATYQKEEFGGKVRFVNYQKTNRWELY